MTAPYYWAPIDASTALDVNGSHLLRLRRVHSDGTAPHAAEIPEGGAR